MIWYKFYLSDYITDTHHLDDAEDLAYRRLIDMYYLTEKPIPLETNLVSRKVRLDLEIVETVLNEFFERTEDGYRHTRCDREIAKYQHQVKVLKQSAQKGGRPKKTKLETKLEPKSDINQISDIRIKNKNTMSAKPTRFDEFWQTWPSSKRKVGKSACEAKWKKNDLDSLADQIISNVQNLKASDQWRDGFEPAPLTYINQRRWEDGTTETFTRRAK
jgi:uncharacterized protein YdaU (DUF1376 family)